MTQAAEKLKDALAVLPEEDRAELARFLIQSLEAEPDPEAEAAWEAELTRRAAEIKSGKAKGTPAEQVRRELREKYS